MSTYNVGLKPQICRINWQNPLTRGLIFDWPLFERNGNVTDLAQLKIATTTGAIGTVGLIGSGYKFGSANTDILTGPVGSFLTGSSYTIMNIFKINTADLTVRRLISYFDVAGGGTNRDMWFEFNSSGTNVLGFGFQDTGGLFPQAQWTSGFVAGSIHMVFGVWNGTTQVIYADGDPSAKATNTPVASYKTASGGTYAIGNKVATSTSLNGDLYTTLLWNRALSAAERIRLYQNPWSIYTKPKIWTPNYSSMPIVT